LIPAAAHAHGHEESEEFHEDAHDHEVVPADHGHDDHGPDAHSFFYTHDQMHAIEHAEHEHEHHELDETHTPKELFISMKLPLIVLAILSAGGGFWLSQEGRFEKWLELSSKPKLLAISEHPHGIPLFGLSLAAAIGGIAIGLLVYWRGLSKREGWEERKWSWFRRSARDQFGYDGAMMTASVQGGHDIALLFWKFFDVRIVDGAVNGAAGLAGWLANIFRRVQTGYIRMYALVMLIGGVAVLGWFAWAANLLGGGR
jgi:NADH-quinone oxidoreductase subunit L